MARIELKGTFTAIMPVQEVGEKKTLKQDFIFETKNVDEFGDQRGEPEQWLITILGDKIKDFALAPNTVGKRAKLTVWVNSKKFTLVDGKIIYAVNLILAKVDYATERNAA